MNLFTQPTTLTWALLVLGTFLFVGAYASNIQDRIHGSVRTSPAVVMLMVIAVPLMLAGWIPLVCAFLHFALTL